MEIKALSRKEMINILETSGNIQTRDVSGFSDTIFISINSTFTNEESPIDKNCKNALVLYFDDTSYSMPVTEQMHDGSMKEIRPISEDQAKEIANFVAQNKDKEQLIVHCNAGQSRSGAVALAINDFMRQDYNKFLRENPKVKPNPRVLTLVRNALNATKAGSVLTS